MKNLKTFENWDSITMKDPDKLEDLVFKMWFDNYHNEFDLNSGESASQISNILNEGQEEDVVSYKDFLEATADQRSRILDIINDHIKTYN